MPDDDTMELALGLSRFLDGFKKAVPQAWNYRDLGLDPTEPSFAATILDQMYAAERIHFNLTGMRRLNAVDGVLKGPARYNALGSTNWELRTIWDDPTLRAKTSFYRDRIPIDERDVSLLS